MLQSWLHKLTRCYFMGVGTSAMSMVSMTMSMSRVSMMILEETREFSVRERLFHLVIEAQIGLARRSKMFLGLGVQPQRLAGLRLGRLKFYEARFREYLSVLLFSLPVLRHLVPRCAEFADDLYWHFFLSALSRPNKTA